MNWRTMARLAPKPLVASTRTSQPIRSRVPSGRVIPTPSTRPASSAYTSVTCALVTSCTPASSAARSSVPSSSAPVRLGRPCRRGLLWPKSVRQAFSTENCIPWRSISQSMVGPLPYATARASSGSVWPRVLAMMSSNIAAAESSTSASRWARVPAAQIKPWDMLVVPKGAGLRSSTATSAPASAAARAAVIPVAPAPITSTGAWASASN